MNRRVSLTSILWLVSAIFFFTFAMGCSAVQQFLATATPTRTRTPAATITLIPTDTPPPTIMPIATIPVPPTIAPPPTAFPTPTPVVIPTMSAVDAQKIVQVVLDVTNQVLVKYPNRRREFVLASGAELPVDALAGMPNLAKINTVLHYQVPVLSQGRIVGVLYVNATKPLTR
jgi:hypothetical protein